MIKCRTIGIVGGGLSVDNWKEFVFNEPYVGGKIECINNVILPKQYVCFMKKHNGGRGDIGETWLELYPLEELQEINDDYCIEDFLPNHIIIGSNGNGELYGDDYSYFCDFISERLCEQPIFTAVEKDEVILIMSYLKKCGIYAQKFNCEEIPEDDVDIEKTAYVRDNLYDIICDKIGKLYKENPDLIPYERNNNIKR